MYVANVPLKVGTVDEDDGTGTLVRREIWRNPGEEVPEAEGWHDVHSYISTNKITYVPDNVVAQGARIDQLEAAVMELSMKVDELIAKESTMKLSTKGAKTNG